LRPPQSCAPGTCHACHALDTQLIIRTANNFYFFTLSKGIDEVQPFFATFCRPNSLFAFYSLQRCQNAKHAGTRKYLRGLPVFKCGLQSNKYCKRIFLLNAFTWYYYDLKIKVQYFTFICKHYGTTQAMRPNYINFQILLDCIVLKCIFRKYYYITLTCSISCVTFFVLFVLSKLFRQSCQTWGFAPKSGVFNSLLGSSSEDLGFLWINCL